MSEPSQQAADGSKSAKIFCGQIGRNTDENDLRTLMSTYGGVLDVTLIKDKATGTSKGCAFVVMADRSGAEAAIAALDKQHSMPGMPNTIQVSFAKGEAGAPGATNAPGAEAKLFVGMISKQADDASVRATFGPFGTVEEVYIMKDKATGLPKGCAFVKFVNRADAQRAIEGLHGKVTMPDQTSPLVVKYADPPKAQQMMMGGAGGAMAVSAQGQIQHFQAQMMAAQAQLLAQQNIMQAMGAWGQPPQPAGHAAVAQPQWGQQPAAAYDQTQAYAQQGMYPPADPFAQQAAYGAAAQPYGAAPQQAYGAAQGAYGAAPAGVPGMGMAGMGMPGMGMMGGYPGMGGAAAGAGAPRTPQGPAQANLFIYHIPVSWGDAELLSCFQPFGTVISATVFKDKTTGQSKGFGFVSYDQNQSAANAIAAMNGMQVEGKRLKVEIKKAKAAPY
eukprot:CAMPEP_0173381322 /NCGR_PEP_ID=MMETSP1356-20130122/3702_1 /TAXON_ID=77927 ORGANISM="Hemiselmis virescens, Strain PCC157" /NCGR_SAMPLE_ID=MMETSP1356 /ASSEMBLY_ACC=CAM_ASM_000847 /LENGTH=444 /DNA_ID=CAMNT_0014335091 /DNA_START=8 /DNA_END=1342 /DNA_ORIENTATION=-